MKKIITCLFFIIIASLTQAQDEAGGGSLDCTIGNVNYVYFNQLMSCTATSKVKIEKRNVIVTSVCGVLDTSDVKVFYALAKVIKYIPKNLDYVFENLIGFRLENTQLKIVTSEDLKPFPELVMFASVSNHIEFLEEELFKFNPKLEYVSFRANKITYIHPNVFAIIAGESGKLQQLYMDAQAINCGIGNPTTKDAIAKALTKFSGPSSLCADINSASLLYNLWFELKSQVSGGNEELETCQNNLAACTDDLASKNEEFDETLQEITGKFAQCCEEIRSLSGGPIDYC